MTEKPKYLNTVSLGNVIQLLAIIVAGAGVVLLTEARSKGNERAIQQALVEISAMESRLRMMEQESARGDERYSYIISSLTRIDGRLERIERGSE